MIRQQRSYAPFDASRAAVVVIDMINHQIHGMDDKLVSHGIETDYYRCRLNEIAIPNVRALLDAARTSGARVVYLRMGSNHADFADVVPVFRDGLRGLDARDGQWSCEVIDELRPVDGDINLMKAGSGGFFTSSLDSVLRNMRIEHLFYTGVVTPGCVLVTALVGNDLGYYGYVASDATACFSDADQQAAEAILAQGYAHVLSTSDCLAMLGDPQLSAPPPRA